MMESFWSLVALSILVWPLWPLLGFVIGNRKGDALGSTLICLVLGPLGVVFALLSSGDGRNATCPHCHGRIPKRAKVCLHCARDVR